MYRFPTLAFIVGQLKKSILLIAFFSEKVIHWQEATVPRAGMRWLTAQNLNNILDCCLSV